MSFPNFRNTISSPCASLLRFEVRPLGDGLDLVPHVLLELVGRFGVGRALVVVFATIVEDEASVLDELFRRRVLVGLELRLHGGEIHRLLDDFVVIGYVVFVDGV